MNYNSRLAHGLMFHRFSNSKKNNYIPGTLIKKDLEDIIKYVGRNRILTPQEWLDRLAKNKNNKIVILTRNRDSNQRFEEKINNSI